MNRAAILVSLLMAAPANAHDIYHGWTAWDGGSCCSERKEKDGHVTGDCRPARAVQDMEGNWIAYSDGREYRIPPQAVRPIKSPDGRSHICEMHGHIFCFVPGEVRS
jgi:hypothetical protein